MLNTEHIQSLSVPVTPTSTAELNDVSSNSTFESSLKSVEREVSPFNFNLDVLPPAFRNSVADVLNQNIFRFEVLDEMLEKFDRAFDVFTQNLQSPTADKEVEVERLQWISVSMIQMAVDYGHTPALDGVIDKWSTLSENPALHSVSETVMAGFKQIFASSQLSFAGFQQCRIDYVSHQEKRKMTMSMQLQIWAHFKEIGQETVVEELADVLATPNSEIEAAIVKDSKLASGLSAVPAVDMGFSSEDKSS